MRSYHQLSSKQLNQCQTRPNSQMFASNQKQIKHKYTAFVFISFKLSLKRKTPPNLQLSTTNQLAAGQLLARQSGHLHSHLDQRVIDFNVGFHESTACHNYVIRGYGQELGVDDTEQNPKGSHFCPDRNSEHFEWLSQATARCLRFRTS